LRIIIKEKKYHKTKDRLTIHTVVCKQVTQRTKLSCSPIHGTILLIQFRNRKIYHWPGI